MRISARYTTSSPERTSSTATNRFRAPITYDSESDSSDEDDFSSDEEGVSYDLDISVDASKDEDNENEDDAEDEDGDGLLVPWNKLSISGRTPEQERSVSEAVVSVRNHANYVDPYEEWESRTRRDAFLTARRHQSTVLHEIREGQRKFHSAQQQQHDANREKELETLHRFMETHRKNSLAAESQLRERWKERDKKLWERIEASIREEEEKLRMAQEAQRKAREEAERKRREQEEKRRKEEENKRKAEEERRQKELEDLLQKELEVAAEREKEERARKEKTQDTGLVELRERTGMFDCGDMWKIGLRCLKYIKLTTMRAVKGPKPPDPEPLGYRAPPPPPLKKLWSAQRRKITPKIGQLTDDEREINRISEELKAIVAPIPNMPRPEEGQSLHYALLVSFSKAVIAQAETEVTAHKAQAGPLARVAVSLITAYPPLGDIFFARLCARAGCWAAGVEPLTVEDETWEQLPEKEKQKRWGARSDENLEEQMTRISGVMRLYFAMLFAALKLGVHVTAAFRPSRFWLYLAQLLNNRTMLEKPVAPEIIYVALDEGGIHAKAIWGKQFIKMLQFMYEGLTGDDKLRFGGSEVLAQAARARCLLEIEKVMAQ
ncbi:GLE1 [Sanghuangporus sanghuang]